MSKKKTFIYLDSDEVGHYYLPDLTDERKLYIINRILEVPKKKIVLRKSR
jgi:hypothetical protein